ncbi:PHD finger protein 7-like [Lagopus muta]|uniref:PHD finger protein 7-like n=1 Tax=Lagopus muta TaxID=64668 RepID=UPI0020A13F9D|nr:PHD finger protein 7-like [Lagopus muta]
MASGQPLRWHSWHIAAPGTAPGGTWPHKALTAVPLSSPACVLCGQGDADKDIYGHKLIISGIYFHQFCALFVGGLLQGAAIQKRNDDLSRVEIIHTIVQAEQTLCFVCGNLGAAITCAEPGCDRSFHLPCASKGECVTQYFGEYRSFCTEHHLKQAVKAAPAQDTTCIICMEPVGDSVSYSTMVCPACRHAWFHRACIQRLALCAGITLHCPHCKDEDEFFDYMNAMGIRIPSRGPIWDNNSYVQEGDKHKRCDARECRYPHGRDRAGEGPWQLLLCSSCAARGTHRRCSYLSLSTKAWECNACAGEGTCKRQTAACCWAGARRDLAQVPLVQKGWESVPPQGWSSIPLIFLPSLTASSSNVDSAGPSTATQQGHGPLQGPVTSQTSSGSSITSQAPSGSAHSSKVPESRGLSSQRRIKWKRMCSRLHRIDDACNELQGCYASSRAAAPSTESSTPTSASQRTSRSLRHSRAVGCSRRRSRSRR